MNVLWLPTRFSILIERQRRVTRKVKDPVVGSPSWSVPSPPPSASLDPRLRWATVSLRPTSLRSLAGDDRPFKTSPPLLSAHRCFFSRHRCPVLRDALESVDRHHPYLPVRGYYMLFKLKAAGRRCSVSILCVQCQ